MLQEKGRLLLKGETGFITRIGPALLLGVMLFIVDAVIHNLAVQTWLQFWRWFLLPVIVLLVMRQITLNMNLVRLYEEGIEMMNPFWRKYAFYRFDDLCSADPFRENMSSKYNHANYLDGLNMKFENLGSLQITNMELDNFYEFRAIILARFRDAKEQGI